MSETSPSELARIHKLAEDDVETRRELLTNVAILLERSTESREWQRLMGEWKVKHDIDDARGFTELRTEISALKSRVGNVSSSVDGIAADAIKDKINSRYTLKDVVVGWLALCGAIGMLIGFIGWYLSGGPKS